MFVKAFQNALRQGRHKPFIAIAVVYLLLRLMLGYMAVPCCVIIAHAGGTVQGKPYTNSFEALEQSYTKGVRLMELDFLRTSDGKIVCVHDWEIVPGSNGKVMSLDAFLVASKTHGYTPCTLETLAGWLKEKQDVRVVTDVKNDNLGVLEEIASSIPDAPARIIPQIYGLSQYEPVRAMGYTDIIFTLYRTLDLFPTIYRAAKKNRFFAITISKDTITWLDRLYPLAGVPVFTHTVNDCDEALAVNRSGASGLYTDTLFDTDACFTPR